LPLIAAGALVLDALLRQRGVVRADASQVAHVCAPSAVAALALALLSTGAAISRGHYSLGQRVSILRLVTLAVAPLSLLPMLLLVYNGAGQPPREALHPLGLPCFSIASFIAGASLLVLIVELRHSVTVAVQWRSAALGSAAAAWSSFALLVHCSSVDLSHLLIGHFIPIALFPVIGLVIARRYLKL
jgi:hypothetical protein